MTIRAQAAPHEQGLRPTALIISLTPIFDAPRVRRQAVTLENLGWDVYLAGFRGRSVLPDEWTWVPLDRDQVYERRAYRWLMPLSFLSNRFAEEIYWANLGDKQLLERVAPVPCDLVIAHDYHTVPLAAAVADIHGVDYVVDCHEYSRAEFLLQNAKARLRWMLFNRPYVDAILRRFLPRARAVSTVSDGLADILQCDYRLVDRPAVLRSLPEYEAHSYRPCGETIQVLYHGLGAPCRGLEQAIDSVALWRPEFKLSLRLMATEAYIDSLEKRAVRNGVSDRVEFLEPVLFPDIIGCAVEADIGYCVLEDFSPQRRFSLPNKFFEYTMAGLGVVCSDLSELRKLGERYRHCVFVDRFSPVGIAECINNLSPGAINRLKQRALEAARELCWENEQAKMIAAYLDHPAALKT